MQPENLNKKIYSQNLSNDAKDILEIALLTNSNVPSINITKEEFYERTKTKRTT